MYVLFPRAVLLWLSSSLGNLETQSHNMFASVQLFFSKITRVVFSFLRAKRRDGIVSYSILSLGIKQFHRLVTQQQSTWAANGRVHVYDTMTVILMAL